MRVHPGIVVAACLAAGTGIGVLSTLGSEPPDSGDVRRAVGDACASASHGDYASLWASLAPSTRKRFEVAHRGLLVGAKYYVDGAGSDPRCRRGLDLLEKQYGMPAARLRETTPESHWCRIMERTVAAGGGSAEFAAVAVESVECDGVRARVAARTVSGLSQGFLLVKEEGRWWIQDFRPFDVAGVGVLPGEGPPGPALGGPGGGHLAVPPPLPTHR